MKNYFSPGRIELGGNHTDHQNGRVLAAAVDRGTTATACMRDDNIIRVVSEGYGETVVDVNDLEPEKAGKVSDIIKGMVAGFKDAGGACGGFEAHVTSNIPAGAGLSSSASFEILIGKILNDLYNDNKFDAVAIAQMGQRAEMEFYGKPCGLMDQLACAWGGIIYVDFENPDSPLVSQVDFDFEKYGYEICITNTGGSHEDMTEDYAAVPREMTQVAEYFGKSALRQVDKWALLKEATGIRRSLGDRPFLRAMHFMNENERVGLECEALKAGDVSEFLRLVRESGNSSFKYLQNVYAGKEQPISVALSVSEDFLGSAGASRVHGGGFAGTIITIVKKESAPDYISLMNQLFGADSCQTYKIKR